MWSKRQAALKVPKEYQEGLKQQNLRFGSCMFEEKETGNLVNVAIERFEVDAYILTKLISEFIFCLRIKDKDGILVLV